MTITEGSPDASRDEPPSRWVALVGPEVEENLSLRYLASSLAAAGFESEILPFNGSLEIPALIDVIVGASPPPFLVGLSMAFQWRAMDATALALGLRARGYAGHITAGGHFGSFSSREVLSDFPELDSICCHEAEGTLVELARAVAGGRPLEGIAGLAVRDGAGEVKASLLDHPPDLASLPWPDRRGEPTSCLGHRVAPMISSRGCYANCSFCCIAAWHERMLPGKRYRLRPVEDVADEMAWLNRERRVDIFVFHDDNFFVPGHGRTIERLTALADALEARRVGRIATVVKARPNDVTAEVFTIMKERLGCTRVFLGVENDAEQGLRTLGRRVSSRQNHDAMDVLRDLEVYVCFNLLLFDPETSLESLARNLEFMEANGDSPFNFGRVELYAGTPLLARLQAAGRCRGDYVGYDYSMASAEVQRIFELAMRCFAPRNFHAGALANRLMGTRYDVEVCRHFHFHSQAPAPAPAHAHADVYRPEWLSEARELSRRLARGSVAGLREITGFVTGTRWSAVAAHRFVADLSARLRAEEETIRRDALDLEQRIQLAVGATCRHVKPPFDPRGFCRSKKSVSSSEATPGGKA